MAKSTKNKTKSNGSLRATTASFTQQNLDPSAPVEIARYKERLPCAINEAVAMVAADELGKIIAERAVWLERRKATNVKAREQRSFFDEQIEILGAKVATRTAVQDVEVVEYLFADEKTAEAPRGVVKIVRLDDGSSIGNRPAEDEDLQVSLLDGTTGKPAKEKGKKASAADLMQQDMDLERDSLGEP
jgi:hypothetical protein